MKNRAEPTRYKHEEGQSVGFALLRFTPFGFALSS
jgi:hypothetical protein